MGSYRDDLEAAQALVASLRRELEKARAEIERLAPRRSPRPDVAALIKAGDMKALVDSIPEAQWAPPPRPPPIAVRSLDEAMEWMSEHLDEFARVWSAAYALAGRLLVDKRGEINPYETRGDTGARWALTGVIRFLTGLWVELPATERGRWPYGHDQFKICADSPELDKHLRRLEKLYWFG